MYQDSANWKYLSQKNTSKQKHCQLVLHHCLLVILILLQFHHKVHHFCIINWSTATIHYLVKASDLIHLSPWTGANVIVALQKKLQLTISKESCWNLCISMKEGNCLYVCLSLSVRVSSFHGRSRTLDWSGSNLAWTPFGTQAVL